MSQTAAVTELAWHAHPAVERAGAAVFAAATVLSVGAAVGVATASVAWGVLGLVVLVAALNRFFLPSRFVIDSDGITARYPLRRQRYRWRDVRRFLVDEHGGWLSTRATRSWLDPHRGLHVLFGRQRQAVIDRIRAHLDREAGP